MSIRMGAWVECDMPLCVARTLELRASKEEAAADAEASGWRFNMYREWECPRHQRAAGGEALMTEHDFEASAIPILSGIIAEYLTAAECAEVLAAVPLGLLPRMSLALASLGAGASRHDVAAFALRVAREARTAQ